jgi:tetratricopeptide (TPR) repeat protein
MFIPANTIHIQLPHRVNSKIPKKEEICDCIFAQARDGERRQPTLCSGRQRAGRPLHARLAAELPRVPASVGYAYILSGLHAKAIALLEDALERPAMTGTQEGQSLRIIWLSEAYLLAGRELDARTVAHRALDITRQHKERGHEAYTLLLLGEIAAHEDPVDIGKAETNYRQALALAGELGMRPLVAHCHVGLGKLYRRIGSRRQQAEEHLATAIAMMREVEMGSWLEQAEAELKELGKG